METHGLRRVEKVSMTEVLVILDVGRILSHVYPTVLLRTDIQFYLEQKTNICTLRTVTHFAIVSKLTTIIEGRIGEVDETL